MKVSVEDIKRILPGQEVTFKCNSPKGLNNAQVTAAYVQSTYPERGVKYSCKRNRPKMEITIKAIPVMDDKK